MQPVARLSACRAYGPISTPEEHRILARQLAEANCLWLPRGFNVSAFCWCELEVGRFKRDFFEAWRDIATGLLD
jgi:hypothetical protein